MAQFIESGAEFKKTEHIVPFIAGFVLFVSSFLPWVSFSMFNVTKSANAFSVSGGLGVLCLFSAFVAMGTAFLRDIALRGGGQIASAVLAFLSLLIVWSKMPGFSSQGPGGQQMKELQEAVSKMGGMSLNVGAYLFLITGIALVVIGIWTFQKNKA